MLVAHASDLHGSYKKLAKVPEPDLWIISGDFFPSYGRGEKTGGVIRPNYEHSFQLRWFGYRSGSIMEKLRGKPVIWVPGNHDYISLAAQLQSFNYSGMAYDLTQAPAEVLGKRFAGFREINYLCGEWAGETHDFKEIVSKVMEQDPEILVTHAPPAGILDSGHGFDSDGISELSIALAYRQHRITHHFFGHIHEQGGRIQEEMGIKFVNSATTIQMVEI